MTRPITIIPSGNAVISTAQSKFGGASVLFDGDNDSLVLNDPTLVLGTGNFTTEFWFRPAGGGRSGSQGYNRVWQSGPNAKQGLVTIVCEATANPAQLAVYIYTGGSYQRIILSSTTAANETWHHVALTRSSGIYTLWLNGVSVGTNSSYTTFSQVFSSVTYGQANQPGLESYFGYLDELRISNTARYTGSFTPSSTAFTNDGNTLFLCHCNGTNESTFFFDDDGSTPVDPITTPRRSKYIQAIGNAQVSTAQSKFGGASYLSDGTGDRLEVSHFGDLTFGTGDFTIECWFRVTTTAPTYQVLFDAREQQDAGFSVEINGSNVNFVRGYTLLRQYSSISTNTWYHFAASRSGDQIRVFIDGTQVGANITNNSVFTSVNPFKIGDSFNLDSAVNGNIDEIRLSNSARYTANFTPSTVPFVNDTNTVLLIHGNGTNGSNEFFDDAGVRNSIGVSAIGNAQVSTAQSKFGGASYLSDGTGDYLLVNNALNTFTYGTNNFTIEMWVRYTSTKDFQILYDGRTTSTFNAITPVVYVQNGNQLHYFVNGVDVITTSVTTNTWYHVAISRSGSSTRMFLNGTQVGTTYTDSNNYICDSTLWLGSHKAVGGSNAYSLVGNMDEVRVSNTARYTSNFTPATTQFVNDSNTLLLLHMDGANASIVFNDDNSGTSLIIEEGAAALSSAFTQSADVSKFKGTKIDIGYYIDDDYIDFDYYYDNAIRFSIAAELTEVVGEVVEANGAFTSSFTQTAQVQRNRFVESTVVAAATVSAAVSRTRSATTSQSSQFNIFALGSRSTDIDLVAFNQASLTVSGNRIRFADSTQSSTFAIQIAVGGIQPGSASLSSAFAQTAQASKTMTLESAMTFDFTPTITVNAIRVVAVLAEIMSALNSSADRNRSVTVALENILNLSSQSDRIRDYNSQVTSQADLTSTATKLLSLSADLTASSSLQATISHIEGADMFAFGASTLSANVNVIAVATSGQASNFNLNSSLSQSIDADSNMFVVSNTQAFARILNRNTPVEVRGGGAYDDFYFDAVSKQFGASLARTDDTDIRAVTPVISNGTNLRTFGVGYTWTSTDGVNWTRTTNNIPALGSLGPLKVVNGNYVVTNGSIQYFSSDGSNFTQVNVNPPTNYPTTSVILWDSLIFRNGFYYALWYVANSRRGVVRTDNLNGGTWTTVGNFGTTYSSIEYIPESIFDGTNIIFPHKGIDNTIEFVYSSNGTTWNFSGYTETGYSIKSFSGTAGDYAFYSGRDTNTGRIRKFTSIGSLSSPTQVSNPQPLWRSVSQLLKRNNRWFLVVEDGVYSGTNIDNLALTSLPRETLGYSNENIEYQGSRWVLKYDTEFAYHSTDGVNWTKKLIENQENIAPELLYSLGNWTPRTVDFWWTGTVFLNQYSTISNEVYNFEIRLGTSSRQVRFRTGITFNQDLSVSGTISGWNHFRFTTDGTTGSMYINGSRVDTATIGSLLRTSNQPIILELLDSNSKIDELLITDEILTSPSATSFTVPTRQYANTSNTRLLAHYNVDVLDDGRTPVVERAFLTANTVAVANTNGTFGAMSLVMAMGTMTIVPQKVVTDSSAIDSEFTLIADGSFVPQEFEINLSAAFTQSALAQSTKPFDSAMISTANISASALRIFDFVIETDAIATQMTVAAKTGSNLITLISNSEQTAVVHKITDVVLAVNGEFTQTADADRVGDGQINIASDFALSSDLDRIRFASLTIDALTASATFPQVTYNGQSQLDIEATVEASPAGSRVGINAVLTPFFDINVDVEKIKEAQVALSASTSVSAIGLKTSNVDADLDTNSQLTATALRIRNLGIIDTDAVATQLTAVAKVGNTLVTVIVNSSLTAEVQASKSAIVELDSQFVQTSAAERTRDLSSVQSVTSELTATGFTDKEFVVEMNSDFTLVATGQVSAVINLVAFTNATLDIDTDRIRSADSTQISTTTVNFVPSVLKQSSVTLDSDFTQSAVLSGKFFGTINARSTFVVSANTSVVHITQYVYKIPSELRQFNIPAESREIKIISETRLYKIRRQ